MSQHLAMRRVRLHLFHSFFKRTQPSSISSRTFSASLRTSKTNIRKIEVATNDFEKRVEQLEKHQGPSGWYPRLGPGDIAKRISIGSFRRKYEGLGDEETVSERIEAITGRVQSVRTAGTRLVFVDLKQGGMIMQAVVQLNKLSNENLNGSDEDLVRQRFKKFANTVRKGDWWQFQGYPHRSKSGELSVQAQSIPKLISPSLHQIPEKLEDPEAKAKNRHVDMLVNPVALQTIRMRHLVEKYIRGFFDYIGFTEVHTPLLTAGVGGAVARPFDTTATELDGQTLNLRIAPELWLKRLAVGGMQKVYELGPAFRNEGVDATHNPEFYICEFYEAFSTLDDLMAKTENLLSFLSTKLAERGRERESLSALPPVPTFNTPFQRLEFIPTLESNLGHALPDLSSPTAQDDLLEIFKSKDIQPPSTPTLPRLLDALSAHYLEPLCQESTFITHHPACLSPLSKHFICPHTGQAISARAELFIAGREIANMYEEENSPFEQRKKFVEQLKYRAVDGEGDENAIDESYIKALEWGLPPTGGWGCGVDRLVMLFTGRERIGDVLPFGTLRNVVAAGR